MTSEAGKQRELLPAHVRPTHYELVFEPHLDPPVAELLDAGGDVQGRIRSAPGDTAFTFDGQAKIVVSVTQPTQAIVLHVAEMTVSAARVEGPAGIQVPVLSKDLDAKAETLTLGLAGELQPGEFRIFLEWSAPLNNKMLGFYRSAYKIPKDAPQARYMAVTQFEPTDARRAFPCFDEPALKATFAVSLVVSGNRVGLSNMPVAAEEVLDVGTDRRKITFETTPIMSTYLLAFIVGELEYVEARTSVNSTLVRVYTLPGSSQLGQFALEVAVKTLDFFTDFFGTAYPLPKCDMAAIPDFAAGAMENWGCITFRETALLLDPANSSASAKSRVAEVVAHELAHQWFGNLVTMEWWTHLWLNEGFATWAADLAVDELFPTWQTWMQFVCTTFSGALRLDALASSHPIEVEVTHAHQVNEIFDAISYYKGASAIRMLVEHLGLDVFQRGLRLYFAQHPYKNTCTEDLWAALERAAGDGVKVEEMMRKWTQQVGYPVLTVSKNGAGAFSVAQERFLSDGSADEGGSTWMVPVRFVSSEEPGEVRSFTVEGAEASVPGVSGVSGGGGVEWLKLNSGQSGIYRVLYPADMYSKFRAPMEAGVLSSTDRLGILMDAMALARAGKLSTTLALEVLCGYRKEREYTCLVDVVGSLREVTSIFGIDDAGVKGGIAALARELLEDVGTQVLGWEAAEGEEHVTALARTLVLSALIENEHEGTIEEAKRRFARYVEEPSSLPADLRLPVYIAVVKSGGAAEHATMIEMYEKAELNEEKIRVIQCLGKTKSAELLRGTLEWGLKAVKPQDLFYVVMTVGSNPLGREMAWEFVKGHWEEFLEKYGRGNFLLTRFLELGTRGFASAERAAEVEEFFRARSKEGIERTLTQCLEGIRVRSGWRERDAAAVRGWFERRRAG